MFIRFCCSLLLFCWPPMFCIPDCLLQSRRRRPWLSNRLFNRRWNARRHWSVCWAVQKATILVQTDLMDVRLAAVLHVSLAVILDGGSFFVPVVLSADLPIEVLSDRISFFSFLFFFFPSRIAPFVCLLSHFLSDCPSFRQIVFLSFFFCLIALCACQSVWFSFFLSGRSIVGCVIPFLCDPSLSPQRSVSFPLPHSLSHHSPSLSDCCSRGQCIIVPRFLVSDFCFVCPHV